MTKIIFCNTIVNIVLERVHTHHRQHWAFAFHFKYIVIFFSSTLPHSHLYFVYKRFPWWFLHSGESTFVSRIKLAEQIVFFSLDFHESTHIKLHGASESKSNIMWKRAEKYAQWVGFFVVVNNCDAFSRRTGTVKYHSPENERWKRNETQHVTITLPSVIFSCFYQHIDSCNLSFPLLI